MSDRSWSSLSAPFPLSSVRWHAVDRSHDGRLVRLAPHLATDALRARLDEGAGPDAWSLTLRAWGDDALIAELAFLGASGASVSRAVVSRALKLPALAGADGVGSVSAADATTGAAWTAAAAAFGATVPIEVLDDGWVDADPESGEGLHPPEHGAASEGVAPRQDGASRQDGARRAAHDDGADASPTRPTSPPTAQGASQGSGASGSGGTGSGGTGSGSAEIADKPDGHQVIDRLVERLRQEGLGADAARLVTSYGGYGGDAEASRELYAKLRALLVQRSARP
ncbi:MAG: hypothetical protein U5J97_04485 [Trueperaceae bacterium]|nr:hypothetical protein [Trueperaceae bacterium]